LNKRSPACLAAPGQVRAGLRSPRSQAQVGHPAGRPAFRRTLVPPTNLEGSRHDPAPLRPTIAAFFVAFVVNAMLVRINFFVVPPIMAAAIAVSLGLAHVSARPHRPPQLGQPKSRYPASGFSLTFGQ
jgi:hypothetical protein